LEDIDPELTNSLL